MWGKVHDHRMGFALKKILIACACVFFPATALAQGVPYSGGYIEGFVGVSIISDVDSDEFSFTDGFDDFLIKSSIDYGTEVSFGLEAGIDGYPSPNLRIGASWDYINAEFDNVHLSGSVNNDPFSINATQSDLDSFGLNLDTALSVFSGHLYYNIPVTNRAIQPYLGIGAGAAFIEHFDTEFAFSATAGVRAAIGEAAYVGGRYRYFYIVGPEDDGGLLFDPINIHSFSVVIGMHVN